MLPALRVICGLPHLGFNGRTEFQRIVMPEDELPDLLVLRLGAECDFAHGKFAVCDPLENANLKGVLKKYGQLYALCVHTIPSLNTLWTKNGQPRRGRLLTLSAGQDGRATYRLWHILADVRCVFIFVMKIKESLNKIAGLLHRLNQSFREPFGGICGKTAPDLPIGSGSSISKMRPVCKQILWTGPLPRVLPKE